MTEYSYKVADLRFVVSAPESFDIEALLPSFAPFLIKDGHFDRLVSLSNHRDRCSGHFDKLSDRNNVVAELVEALGATTAIVRQTHQPAEATDLLFHFTLRQELPRLPRNIKKVEEDENDMGHTVLSETEDGRYCLELGYREPIEADGKDKADAGIFISNRTFSEIYAYIAPKASHRGLILSSMLRIAFAQAVILRDGVSLHASAVAADGKAFLFLGKSGTGKSTHSRMWLRNIPGSHLLNDDNPVIRVLNGEVIAFGTPWSGKTPCYRNESFPVGGIARLIQGDSDIFTKKDEVAAFVALLPSCSVVRCDKGLRSRLYDTIAKIVELIPIGELKCLPDNESALICYNNFKSLIK